MSIIIYTTPFCPWCKKVKDFFNENTIKFEEIDVSKDQKAAQDIIKRSGQFGVPVIEINKKFIIGFDEAKLKKELNL